MTFPLIACGCLKGDEGRLFSSLWLLTLVCSNTIPESILISLKLAMQILLSQLLVITKGRVILFHNVLTVIILNFAYYI